jgi:hypothetical protein
MKPLSEQDAQNLLQQRRWLVGLLLFMAATTAVWCIFWYNFSLPERVDLFPDRSDAVSGQLPGMSEEEIKEQMQREANEQVFSFKINTKPVFEDGESAGTLRIENPQHNTYPFVVEIALEPMGEVVYNSGGILPNHHINEGQLTKVLSKGEYPATAYIYAYSPDTGEYNGKAAVELTLVIKN